MKERLHNLIQKWLLDNKTQHLNGNSEPQLNLDLFEQGILDSMDFLDLISFLETALESEIDLSGFEGDDFGTINGIANQIDRQLNAG